MVVFPNAKINLGLRITGKRADGYHDLETVFYPVPLKDVLEAVKASAFSLHTFGKKIDAGSDTNLCTRAYELIRKDHPGIPPVAVYLYKNIPSGAGLGGGSSDASAMLKLLNETFHLEIPKEKLQEYALELGSDCPFFLRNTPCLATGRGEILEESKLDLSGFSLVLVDPRIHIQTAWAFSLCTPKQQPVPLSKILAGPVSSWKELLQNDFEGPVFSRYPQLQEIKSRLYASGAIYASMTGSGSGIFGLFARDAPAFDLPGTNYSVTHLTLNK